jgi:signal recognition particle subunit SRP54
MTPLERREPAVINGSRRKRIARGSGTRVEDVNRLLKQFVQARKLMKQFGGAGGGRMMKRFMAAPRAHR